MAGEIAISIARSPNGVVNLMIGFRETEDIPVKLKYEAAGRIYALTVDGLGEVKVMVPSSYFDKARRVLMDIFKDEEIPWES